MQNYSRKYTLVLDFEPNLVLVLKLILRLFKFLKTENHFHFGPRYQSTYKKCVHDK